MQLPEFITKSLGFQKNVEEALTKLSQAEARIKELEAASTTSATTLAARDATIKELQGTVQKLQGDVTAKDSEITTLKAAVETEKKRANDVLARQGLRPEDVPVTEPENDQGKAGESAWSKYHRLLASNPKEAGQFWAQNADKILDSRPKA